jgi:S1-C subfamily serine protease
MQAKSKRRKLPVIIAGVVVVVIVAGGGWFGYQHVHAQNELQSEIQDARNLVMFNPLAKGPASKKLIAALPKVGEKTTDKMLRSRLKLSTFKPMVAAAKKEIDAAETKALKSQNSTLATTQSKLTKLSANENFPAANKAKIKKLDAMAQSFNDSKDAVGLNVSVAGLQSLAGDTTSFIAAKTKAQKAREAAKKAEDQKLADAVKNETYPSLGMLRGDLPNGDGVIPMFLIPGGPADNAGLQTDSDWEDSSVITSIDGKPVNSAVIGDHSMQKVLQTIPLGKTVKVGFRDGSSTTVHLNLSQKDAKSQSYPDLEDPGDDTDTDINFGVDGYNIGQKHNNKEIGLVITSIDSAGSVAGSDLKVGDTICRINDYYVGDTTDIQKIMYNYTEGDTVTVSYVTASGHLDTADVELTD